MTLGTCSHVGIAPGPEISPATGQNPLALVLTNRGPECVLDGYPAVALLDARDDVLPFVVSHLGDQQVTDRPPVEVRLQRGDTAYFMLNKYRCDLGTVRTARVLLARLPGARRPLDRISIAHPPRIGYCGRGDPGSIVTVSPVEPTLADATRLP
jgi:hypothetical protein